MLPPVTVEFSLYVAVFIYGYLVGTKWSGLVNSMPSAYLPLNNLFALKLNAFTG